MGPAKFSQSFFKRKNILSSYTIYLKKLTRQGKLLFARPVCKETVQEIHPSGSNLQIKSIMSSSCDSNEKGIKISAMSINMVLISVFLSPESKDRTEMTSVKRTYLNFCS